MMEHEGWFFGIGGNFSYGILVTSLTVSEDDVGGYT